MVLGILASYTQKNQTRLHHNTYKNKLSIYWRLKCNTPKFKTSRRKHSIILFDTGLRNIFLLDISLPQANGSNTEINKWDNIKLKSLSTVKGTNNNLKRKPTEWQNIFANDIADKRLMYKIYKELTQFNIKKNKNKTKQNKQSKWKLSEVLSRQVSKAEILKANRHMERC